MYTPFRAELRRSDSVFASLELVGQWWFPEDPSKKVQGRVTGCVAEELKLEIDGSLEDFHSAKNNRIILGHTQDYVEVTLLQSWLQQTNGQQSTYFVHWVLVGGHFPTTDFLLFHKLRFGIHLLEEWHNVHSFSNLQRDGDGMLVHKYRPPERVHLGECGPIKVFLDYDLGPEVDYAVQTQVTIAHAARLELLVDDGAVPLFSVDHIVNDSNLMTMVQNLCAFFSLASSAQVFSYDMKAYPHQSERQVPNGTNCERAIHVFRIGRIPKTLPRKQPWDMEFTWEHVKSNPCKHFNAWLSKAPSIDRPIWLYLDAVCGELRHMEDTYIALAQALEGYHRYAYPEANEPTEEHQNMLKDIYASVPPDHIEWLKEQLMYSHEPRLARRLKDLFRNQKDVTVWLLGAWKCADAWINQIRITRNAHAHCLGSNIATVFSEHPRSRQREATLMRAILFRYLLKEIEFDDARAEQIVKSNREFLCLAEYGSREVRVVGSPNSWSVVVMGSGATLFQSHSEEEVFERGRDMACKKRYKFTVQQQDGSIKEICSFEDTGKEKIESGTEEEKCESQESAGS